MSQQAPGGRPAEVQYRLELVVAWERLREEISGRGIIGGGRGGQLGCAGGGRSGPGRIFREAGGDGAAGGARRERPWVKIDAEAPGGVGSQEPALGIGQQEPTEAGEVGAEGPWGQDEGRAEGVGGCLPIDHVAAAGSEAAQRGCMGAGRGGSGLQDSLLRTVGAGRLGWGGGRGNRRERAGCQRAGGEADE